MRLTPPLIRFLGSAIAATYNGTTRLCVINYHRVLEVCDPLLDGEPDVHTFQWHMELLAGCFNVMPLYEAVERLAKGKLPPRAVCITFDDGYRSVYELALPILMKLSLPATVFVAKGSGESNMWNDRILGAIRRLPSEKLDLQHIGLGIHTLESLDDRRRTLGWLSEATKYRPPEERLVVIEKLEQLAGIRLQSNLMLTGEMIATLASHGIEIGGHTSSHPILTTLTDEAARREILDNKRHLEAIIERPVRLFAYPNGKLGKDFNERHVEMVKAAGYAAAFTTERGAATKVHCKYQLPRSRPWDSTPLRYGVRLLSWFSNSPL